MRYIQYYDYPTGILGLAEEEGQIIRALFGRQDAAGYEETETPLLRRAAQQLEEYYAGKRKAFDLPLHPRGTPFQQAVWAALQAIPYGETRSYKEVAALVGSPRACRAVGMANHCNPIPVLIPCHRVVGSTGSMTGYAGGVPMKEALLKLEQANNALAIDSLIC